MFTYGLIISCPILFHFLLMNENGEESRLRVEHFSIFNRACHRSLKPFLYANHKSIAGVGLNNNAKV
jgi:hypothetical protein